MRTFTERMTNGDAKALERFDSACKEVFGGQAGRLVLAMLLKGAHPLAHEAGMNDHQHGNCEVVTALWRGAQYRGFLVLADGETSKGSI